jgi:hypothetical protein
MSWPSPTELEQIGGWCFAALTLAVIIAGFISGRIVPGWIYKREIIRGDKATDLLAGMTAAMARQTDVIEKIAGQNDVIVRLLPGHRG